MPNIKELSALEVIAYNVIEKNFRAGDAVSLRVTWDFIQTNLTPQQTAVVIALACQAMSGHGDKLSEFVVWLEECERES